MLSELLGQVNPLKYFFRVKLLSMGSWKEMYQLSFGFTDICEEI